MKIKKTSKIAHRIDQLSELENVNEAFDFLLATPIIDSPIIFSNHQEVEEAADKICTDLKTNGVIYPRDTALLFVLFAAVVADNIDSELALPVELVKAAAQHGRLFHKSDLENNPFIKNVLFDERSEGSFVLSMDTFAKYELFVRDTPIYINGIEIPRLGTFDHRFRFPVIYRNDAEWRFLTPNNICSVEHILGKVKGNVLTLGVNTGYFAYMASRKKNVQSVTIVEEDPEVVAMFNICLLPQFENKQKITVICMDSFRFMQNLADNQFDYCFCDVWRSEELLSSYVALKKICKKFEKMQVDFWKEQEYIAAIMAMVKNEILTAHCRNNDVILMDVPDELPADAKKIDRYIRRLLKNAEINKPSEVDYYLNWKNILTLL